VGTVGSPGSWQLGSLRLDGRSGELVSRRRSIVLPEKPLLLLLALLERPGDLVTREELRHRLWADGISVDFEDGLNHAVRQLREILDDDPRHPAFVETVPRRGYRYVGPAERADELETGAPGGSRSGRLWARAGLGAVLAGAFAVAFDTPEAHRSLRGGGTPQIRSLAVLPLASLSGAPDDEYFAEGMTEALLTDLGRHGDLRVISRQSVTRYRGSTKPVPEIARELGVEAVVEGSVLRRGDRVRITIQLILAHEERHLWAESYERDARDVLATQDALAREIANELRARSSLPTRSSPPTRAIRPEAQVLYLKGRYLYHRWPEGLEKGAEFLEQAVAADPEHALAQASLAMCYVDLAFSNPPRDYYERARQAALRALAIDDRSAEAHSALGSVRQLADWDWPGAESAFRRAIELDPGSVETHLWYSSLLTGLGRVDEALLEARRALELDPVSPLANQQPAWVLMMARRYDEAVRGYERALELDPEREIVIEQMAWCRTFQGRFAEAFALFDRLGRSDPNPYLGYLCARSGQRAEALAIARSLERHSERHYHSAFGLIALYGALGDRDRAFTWLDRALAERSADLFGIAVDPLVDTLRDDPRFARCLGRMGLAQVRSAQGE